MFYRPILLSLLFQKGLFAGRGYLREEGGLYHGFLRYYPNIIHMISFRKFIFPFGFDSLISKEY